MPAIVYLDAPLKFNDDDDEDDGGGDSATAGQTTPSDAVWHSRFPLLAVAYAKGAGGLVRVVEYSLEHDSTRSLDDYESDSAQPHRLSWHPFERCLVAGWENGEVTIWTPMGGTMLQAVQHKQAVSIIEWSTAPPLRLITADVAGSCLGWQVEDNSGEQVFYHEIRETLVDLVFRPRARDFFVASESNVIYNVAETGACQDLLRVDGALIRLLFNDDNNTLVTVTDNLVVSQFRVNDEASLEQISRIKLAGSGYRAQIEWLSMGILVVSAGDTALRVVNLKTNDNATLKINSDNATELFVSLAVDSGGKRVCAGTTSGRIFIWTDPSTSDDAEERNSNPYEIGVAGNLRTLSVCNALGLLSAVARNVTVFRAHEACMAYSSQLLVVQSSARQAYIDVIHMSSSIKLDTEVAMRALFAGRDVVAVSNRKRLLFYELQHATKNVKFVGAMNTSSTLVSIHDQNAFVIEDGQIEVRSFQGVLRQTIVAQQDQGEIVSIHVAGFFMGVGSSKGFIRLWDVGGRKEITSHAGPKSLLIPERSKLHSVRCNSNGTKVSAIVSAAGSNRMLPLLYVWDIEEDDVSCLDFSKTTKPGDRNQIYKDMSGTFPTNHIWDTEDPRLLLVECHPCEDDGRAAMAMVFATAEFGLVVQDASDFSHEKFTMIGVQVPYIFMAGLGVQETLGLPEKMTYSRNVFRQSMRDFVGVESCDRETRDAILKLSFYLTVGNMDEAFAAIRSIKNESVWENMARMCVKNRRLDVAPVCLGKMKRISAAMALRQVQEKYPDNVDLQVATLAIHLGMIEEAKDLLEVSGDHRMLVKLLCDSNRWDQALELAEKKSRINLKNTYFRYAKHLEELGKIQEAITYYEKSNTHLQQVPRMLVERDIHGLETYIVKSREPQFYKWWAQYLESQGDTEEALRYYEMAKDFVSLVRINCFFNNVDTAMEIANDVGDRAACFHLARHLESIDRPSDAVHFFSKAGAISNALRVCKDNSMDDQLFYLAIQSRNNQDMLDVAAYFEQGGETQRAVTLYQKAGWLERARELSGDAVNLGDEIIGEVAQEISPNSDAAEVQAATKRLIDMGLTEQAVEILALNGQAYAALDLCEQYDVDLTEPLADKMLRGVYGVPRTQLLNRIAEFCIKQKSFFLAAKKYTEAGDNPSAMKALIQSDDTDKVILFAQAIDDPEIYVQAASYLQTLNWRSQPAIMRHIIEYYTAANDMELLGNFYESCALSEIAEYHNYETALSALNEAYKVLKEAPIGTALGTKIEALRAKIKDIQQFLKLKKLYTDGEVREALDKVQQMLQSPSNNSVVRKGDLYAFIVEHYAENGQMRTALRKLEEMEADCNEGANSFLSEDVLNKIFDSTSGGFSKTTPNRSSKGDAAGAATSRKGSLSEMGQSGDAETGEQTKEIWTAAQ
ncbi:intraflagellar transport protein 140 homolog [Galendromus occidentalis]|uniref:Intraflagellar transport protein 140 homolog n=1 Tax=Galendromus occidentalis TaxID=34638 RepID=A0AAJ6QSI7_9ACAR|nr:intraflagellar transport protein 140 homolog [Galendromus occidentalis]